MDARPNSGITRLFADRTNELCMQGKQVSQDFWPGRRKRRMVRRVTRKVRNGEQGDDGGIELRRPDIPLVILCAPFRKDVLDAQHLSETESLLAAAFLRLFSGWRFRRLIREGADRDAIAHIESLWDQRLLRAIPSAKSRQHVEWWPGAICLHQGTRPRAPWLCRRNPVRVPRAGSEVGTSRSGLTRGGADGPHRRGIGPHTPFETADRQEAMATVFNHVAAAQPDLLSAHDRHSDQRVRGPQKRHRL